MNSVFISGELIVAPIFRPVGDHKVCVLKLAVKDRWNETFIFIDVETWDKHADIIDNLKLNKGDTISVEGSLKMDTWNDKDTGVERSKLFISAINIYPIKTTTRNQDETKTQTKTKKKTTNTINCLHKQEEKQINKDKPTLESHPIRPKSERKSAQKHKQKDFSKRGI